MALLFYFFVYAFLGWCLEAAYAYYKKRRFINRGFLSGPFVPIYGLSLIALHVLMFEVYYAYSGIIVVDIIVVFVFIMGISTFLELMGGAFLFNMFETRWWDYSRHRFNYKGYISLSYSLIWGVLGTIVFLGVHLQMVQPLYERIPDSLMSPLLLALSLAFILDATFTVITLLNFRALIKELKSRSTRLQEAANSLQNQLENPRVQAFRSNVHRLAEDLRNSSHIVVLKGHLERLRRNASSLRGRVFDEFERFKSIVRKLNTSRLYKAFPDLKINVKKDDMKEEGEENDAE